LPTDVLLNAEALKKKELIPALIGAGICLFFSRSGLFVLFFLLPLGFLAFRYGYRVVWNAVFFAVAGNTVLALGTLLRGSATGFFWGILYFAIMTSVFTWIVAPPPGLARTFCGTVRLVIASALSSAVLMAMFLRTAAAPGFLEHIASVTGAMASPAPDVVQAALLAEVTPEMVLDFIRSAMLRGGALISSLLLFFICRQFSFILTRMVAFFAKNRPFGNAFPAQAEEPAPQKTAPVSSSAGAGALGIEPLIVFRVHPMLIWAFSGSLLLVVLSSMASLEIPEIILWNILVICGILYFAQGLGILHFFIAHRVAAPLLKLLLCVTFFVLLFSPGINMVLLGGVAFLGIIEHWVPFRLPKSNGTPSTPEADG